MFFSQLYQFSSKLKKLILFFATVPVKPTNLVVLGIGVVVAALCPTPLISAVEHRYALGKKQGRKEIATLTVAQCVDLWVICRTFDAAIPRLVIIVAVAVAVGVQFIVFFVIADQIG